MSTTLSYSFRTDRSAYTPRDVTDRPLPARGGGWHSQAFKDARGLWNVRRHSPWADLPEENFRGRVWRPHVAHRPAADNGGAKVRVSRTENSTLMALGAALVQQRHKTWGDIHVHALEKLMLLKCPYTRSDLRIQCNPYQNPKGFFFFLQIQRKKLSYGLSKNLK